MDSAELSIEDQLAAALRGEAGRGTPPSGRPGASTKFVEAAIYHGVVGLLADQREALRAWPANVAGPIADQARAQAMWELRHRQVLAALLAALAAKGVGAVLMKGTAIAYDLYENPSVRARGDTDLLVAPVHVANAKAVLENLGFAEGVLGGVDSEFALQQPFTLTVGDGGRHSVDLHWQVMNAPSMRHLLGFAECDANAGALPRLSPDARAMDRVRLLIHTCLHRAVHCNTPYMVEGVAHYGSGRLIWTHDIHLLARALDGAQWSQLAALAAEKGVARVCLDGLAAARSHLGTSVPQRVLSDLAAAAGRDRRDWYLVRSSAMARAWQDLRSLPGLRRKLRYARARIFPSPAFVRGKYPDLAASSLPRIYARRFFALFRARSQARHANGD